MTAQSERLRLALVAGTLGQGGAEKQLVYIVRALLSLGVHVRVYCLTRGEYYESALRDLGVAPIWVGHHPNPAQRFVALANELRAFQPHIIQSAHFYTNLYIAVLGRIWRIMAIGAIRNDTAQDLALNGRWGQPLLRLPSVLIANSYAAKRNAEALGISRDSIHVLPNVVDLEAFDASLCQRYEPLLNLDQPVAVSVTTMKAQKRLDRFLAALAIARRMVPTLRGVLVGDGAERGRLAQLASSFGLLPDGVIFAGQRNDVPALLSQASMLVLSSDHEGFPNVLLEAMAARLPVITTPAGDSGVVVDDGVTGYVLPYGDVEGMAKHMACLSLSPAQCSSMGEAGRRRAEQLYSFDCLATCLTSVYSAIALRDGNRQVLDRLDWHRRKMIAPESARQSEFLGIL